MNKLLAIFFTIAFSTAANAVLVTEPPQAGIAPRANAEGAGYSPPPKIAPNVAAPQRHFPKPAYVENGRPVYNNEPPASEKRCRDNYGAAIKCPDPRATNVNPKANFLPHK